MHKFCSLLCVFCAFALPSSAVETKLWQQDDQADFEKGNLEKLSLRSDGRISLAPVVAELFDSPAPYLWAIARDSKGNLYVGGGGPTGSTAKLFLISPDGKSKTVAELDGLEIHALTVDRQDRVYAATAPDVKVYRVRANGKAEVFYDPHAKYVWSMAFSKKGDLFIATGDQGEIHRVSADGKGSVFFKTEETHARSMILDANDNLIVGTEPGGLILRITPAGAGFILYQAAKREITSVALAADGSVYAAGVGAKQAAAPLTPAGPVMPAPAPAAGGAPGNTITIARLSAPPASLGSASAGIAGGSEVYRINPDGYARRVWSHAHDIAYSISFDATGHALVGAGNKGGVYRLDSDVLYTLLLSVPPTQITALYPGAGGRLYAVTGNIGKVYQIGPGLEKEGSFESEVFDAGGFTYWGRLSFRGGGDDGIRIQTRSGNLSRPQQNWSPWTPVTLASNGGRIASPSARFLQYKVSLTASEVSEVEVAYLAKNVAPQLEEIEITPANYKFPAPAVVVSSAPPSLTLPPLGQRKRAVSPPLEINSGAALQYAKGVIGARWSATDENGDSLIYRVEIRGGQESTWKLLKDKVREKYVSWDSTAFPDGEYRIRVMVSDSPSNPPDQALTSQLESEPFVIDNTPPRITGLAATFAGGKLNVRWKAKDARSVIDKAEYSLDGEEWLVAEPTTRLSDSLEHEYQLALPVASGEHVVAVRVTDECDNQAVDKIVAR